MKEVFVQRDVDVEEWIEGGVIAFIIVVKTCVGFFQVLLLGREGGREGVLACANA